MRAGIGLVSLLMVVGIILMVAFSGPHGGYVPTVLNAGNSGQQQANQISGHDENGIPVSETIALEEQDSSDGHLRGLTVKTILPTSPMVRSQRRSPTGGAIRPGRTGHYHRSGSPLSCRTAWPE